MPLAEQDRSLWDRNSIVESVALITETLSRAPIGPYQLQAAIAAVHDEAATADATDWPQILTLYDLLQRIAPGPIVSLNRIVAVAMVRGARAGLELLAAAELSPDLAATIAWMRFAPTYSNWQVSPRQHERRIRWPRDEPSASLSGGTSSHAHGDVENATTSFDIPNVKRAHQPDRSLIEGEVVSCPKYKRL